MNIRSCFALALAAAMSWGTHAQENILDVRQNYGVGDVVTIAGVVTSGANLGSVRYVQDATAGVAVYPGNDWSALGITPEIGDSVVITGEISEFNGLLEVGPDQLSMEWVGAGYPLPEPQIIAPGQLGEDLEGSLVTIEAVQFEAGGQTIEGNSTYAFTGDLGSGVVYFRNGHEMIGSVMTGCPVNLTGVVSQFSFTGDDGYQLLPRQFGDFVALSGVCITTPVVQTDMTQSSFVLNWDTDVAGTSVVQYGLDADLGQEASLEESVTTHAVTLEGLEAGAIYFARVMTVAGTDTVTSLTSTYATVSNSSGDMHVYFTGDIDATVATDEVAMSLGTAMNDTIASWIASAQHTLDIAVYNFNNSALENALNAAAANGIQIRYIYEGQNANFSLGALDDAIVTHPRTDGEGSGMHNKFIVGDADHAETAFVLTGSTNWTTAQLNTDLNNVIVLEDQSIARTYRMEFEEMWGSSGMTPNEANSKFGAQKSDNTPHQFLVGGSPVEVYFSPTDGTNARIRERIYETDYDLEFALLAFTRDDLSEAVQEVGSTIFVNPVGAIEQINTTGSEYETLIAQGMQVYSHQGVPHDLHHKYCIIDQSQSASDPMVITGSHNWSSTAENVNDENTVIVHDARVANLYHQEFRAIINAITGTPDGIQREETQSWIVMPNPAQGNAWVRGLSQGDVVRLLDMGGREVSCGQSRVANDVRMELEALPAGMYHVVVASTDGGLTTRLLAIQ